MKQSKIKVKRRIHNGWKEWQTVPAYMKNKLSSFGKDGWVGKWQYLYSISDAEISLVHIDVFFGKGFVWEIYQISGKQLFEDVERFPTKKAAEVRIKELLK